MKKAVLKLIAMLVGVSLIEITCWGANSVTLQDMLGKHMDRVMRKSGLLFPTRYGEPFTNWFGRVVMEGEDALPFGYNYIQLRDSDGWAEVRDETGALTREVAPIHNDAAFVLGDLFGFVPSEDTPPELRLSHLVSKWLVCHSEEESNEVDLTEDELQEIASARARRIPRRASAPLAVTNLQVTAISAESDRVTFVTEWPRSMRFPRNRLDLYASVDLRGVWTLHGSYDVAGVNAITTTVMKTSIAGYLESQRAQHGADCYITTNIVASTFEPDVTYTNSHWNCEHKARAETPGFFRWGTRQDSDGDGLTDFFELYISKTDPESEDTDNDGLPDKWEIDNGLDPLSTSGDDGSRGDPDDDRLSNWLEYCYHTNPHASDTDEDGITDIHEIFDYLTDPCFWDSDLDGMSDGWEVMYSLDPLSTEGECGPSGDVDGDGLCNYDEYQLGCHPRNSDSDGDGVSDLDEIRGGLNPNISADSGLSELTYPYRGLLFDIYGDYAAWQMTITGLGESSFVDSFSMASPGFGNERLKILEKGRSYRLTMKWLNSEGHTIPYYWYCWQAKIDGVPQTRSYESYSSTRLSGNEVVFGRGWLAENSDGLLTSHVDMRDEAGGNVAEGLEAILHVYKCEVEVCDPDSVSWQRMDEDRVLLDNEELRVKVTITPAIPTFEFCQAILGDNIVIMTSGTCPNGVSIPISDSNFESYTTHSEIKISKTRLQLRDLGLLPMRNEDGVEEMSAYDVGRIDGLDGSNLSDTFAFESMTATSRGRASNERSLTLNSTPSNARLSESFFKAAGVEVLKVRYFDAFSDPRQIMNQADYFYYSGHGYHLYGIIDDFEPSSIGDWWNRDLDCLIISGCSVLDINDYNNRFDLSPADHVASPGKLWNAVGPNIMLGYNAAAPSDETGEPAAIMRKWVERRATMGDIDAWMDANDRFSGHNACAIEKDVRYHYFKKRRFGRYKHIVVPKGEW